MFLPIHVIIPVYTIHMGSEKSGTNGNFNYFSYFYLRVKVKRLKMALTLDERLEILLLSGRQGWTQRQVADEFNARHPERDPATHSAVGKHGKAAEKMRRVLGLTYRAYNVINK
jgi:hypothetical protein